MSPIRLIARPMLASMFVVGGVDALSNPAGKVPKARDVASTVADTIPQLQDLDAEAVIRVNGAAQVVGGMLLAMGRLPRLASLILASSLVPTTVAGHRFWEESDAGARANQRVHFFKNVSMLGGLLIAAMDTEGRPGLAWRAGHALEHAEMQVDRTRREARLARKLAKAEGKARARNVVGRSRREAKLAARLAKAEGKRRLTPDVVDIGKGVKRLRSSGDE